MKTTASNGTILEIGKKYRIKGLLGIEYVEILDIGYDEAWTVNTNSGKYSYKHDAVWNERKLILEEREKLKQFSNVIDARIKIIDEFISSTILGKDLKELLLDNGKMISITKRKNME